MEECPTGCANKQAGLPTLREDAFRYTISLARTALVVPTSRDLEQISQHVLTAQILDTSRLPNLILFGPTVGLFYEETPTRPAWNPWDH